MKDPLDNKIEWKTVTPSAYDGSTHSHFHVGFDPFELLGFVKKGELTIYLNGKAIKSTEPKFRLPRKLKKQVKHKSILKFSSRDLRFNYQAHKLSKYYNCKIRLEKH